MTEIAYFVHDLNDAAVARRVAMLQAAGGKVRVIGFRRGAQPPDDIVGAAVIDLGRTHDARLLHRAAAVLRHVILSRRIRAAANGADVVIGRNLETLVLAARVRPRPARLVYECLDIHRTLLGASAPHRLIQRLEASLLRQINLLIVSSPAFLEHYFKQRSALTAPTLLAENKVLVLGGDPPRAAPAPAGPPWTIAWFGMLRCRASFDLLTALVDRMDGRLKLLIAGKPSPAIFPDFAALLADKPHVEYVGTYRPAELARLYGTCHFAWAIDYFEEGLNSSWLLPNRLYEASAHGVVPIALEAVETGRWLARHEAGLLLRGGAPDEQLATTLATLDANGYAAMRDRVAAIPRADLIAGVEECEALMRAMVGR